MPKLSILFISILIHLCSCIKAKQNWRLLQVLQRLKVEIFSKHILKNLLNLFHIKDQF